VFSNSRRKGAGRRWRERWPSKIDSNWGKHCWCCCFCQKWPSNRIKNDSRLFEHPQDYSSSDSEREFGKEKVVCTFCYIILDTWAKGRSSHILPRHRDGRCKQTFFEQNYYGKWDLVFTYDPETKRQISECVGETSPRLKKLKFQRSRIKTMLISFFRLSRLSAQRIRTRGKTVNAEFYKGVMDGHLKRIQRVRPAGSASEIFSFCTIMPPPTKLQVSLNFWPPKNKRYNFFSLPVLSRFISARISSVPQVEKKLKDSTLRMLLRSKKP
jgi:hypothetical protein